MASNSFIIGDVFTHSRFGGNQLAVVLDAADLSESAMQAIAAEFGFSETVFVLPGTKTGCDYGLRIFTPGAELPFAGHPLIGSAALLVEAGVVSPDTSGQLAVDIAAGLTRLQVQTNGFVSLTPPQGFSSAGKLDRQQVASLLQLAASDVLQAKHPPLLGTCGTPFVLVQLSGPDALASAQANPAADWPEAADAAGVYCYYIEPGVSGTREGSKIGARMFAPRLGITEDPATGGAACALAGLLCSLEPVAGEYRWEIHQGVQMGRPSKIRASARKTAAGVSDIAIAGQTVRVAKGQLYSDD